MRKLILSSLLSFLILGCSAIPEIERREFTKILDINIDNQNSVEKNLFITDSWWLSYNTSPTLRNIIEMTLSSNKDIKTSQLNIEKSYQAITLAKSQSGFNLNLNGSGVRQKLDEHGTTPPPFNGKIIDLGALNLQASYDLDIFNRVGALAEEAEYKSQATLLNSKWITLNISIQTAKLYYYWNYLISERENLLNQEKIIADLVSLEKEKYNIGMGVEEDYLNAQSQLRDIQSLLKQNQLNLDVTFNSLNSLSGNEHTDELKTLLNNCSNDTLAIDIPTSISSDIITHRFDVAYYLMLVHGQEKHLESAKAGFYPQFSITGQYGFEAVDFNKVLQRSSLAGFIGASVYLPIFNMGAIRANYKVAGIDLNILIEEYNQAVINAYTDINNELLKSKTMESILKEEDQNLLNDKIIWENNNQRFEIGTLSNYSYLINNLQWLQSQLDNNQKHFNFITQQLDFLNSVGGAYSLGGNNGTNK